MINWLFNAQIVIAGHAILWREIIGNAFGIASAIGGMRRRIWAWPIGIVGNVLLFTVFLGVVFHTPQDKNLYGQAGRQVMFVIVSVYGWVQWRRTERRAREEGVADAAAVVPHWMRNWQRVVLVLVAGLLTMFFAWLFNKLGSFGPWADAWIFTGSMLATFGMARGWIEFWLIWLAVDAVGVPLLVKAGYYPSAVLYVVYAGVVVYGFFSWWRTRGRQSLDEKALAAAA